MATLQKRVGKYKFIERKREKEKKGGSLANFKAEKILDEMGMVLTVKLLFHLDSPQR